MKTLITVFLIITLASCTRKAPMVIYHDSSIVGTGARDNPLSVNPEYVPDTSRYYSLDSLDKYGYYDTVHIAEGNITIISLKDSRDK